MDLPHSRAAKFKRALKRPLARKEPSGELGGQSELSTGRGGVRDEVRQRIDSARTEALLDLLKAEDARVGANRPLVGYVVQVLAARLGSYEALHDRGLGWAVSVEREADPGEVEHFFVGWTEDAGRVQWLERWFHPDRPQEIAPELVDRFSRLDGCGGVMGRADDREAASRADKVRRSVTAWRGRPLDALGPVLADRIDQTLGPVSSHELQEFLGGNRGQAVMLALDGRRVCALDSEGNVYRFNGVETRQLARVGLLPRHWFLPMQWWKKKKDEQKAEEEREQDKQRIYKGRYDDEQEVEEEEEKEQYGE